LAKAVKNSTQNAESRKQKAGSGKQMAAGGEVGGLNWPYSYSALSYGVGGEPPVSNF
jgi:hypothetical protein